MANISPFHVTTLNIKASLFCDLLGEDKVSETLQQAFRVLDDAASSHPSFIAENVVQCLNSPRRNKDEVQRAQQCILSFFSPQEMSAILESRKEMRKGYDLYHQNKEFVHNVLCKHISSEELSSRVCCESPRVGGERYSNDKHRNKKKPAWGQIQSTDVQPRQRSQEPDQEQSPMETKKETNSEKETIKQKKEERQETEEEEEEEEEEEDETNISVCTNKEKRVESVVQEPASPGPLSKTGIPPVTNTEGIVLPDLSSTKAFSPEADIYCTKDGFFCVPIFPHVHSLDDIFKRGIRVLLKLKNHIQSDIICLQELDSPGHIVPVNLFHPPNSNTRLVIDSFHGCAHGNDGSGHPDSIFPLVVRFMQVHGFWSHSISAGKKAHYGLSTFYSSDRFECANHQDLIVPRLQTYLKKKGVADRDQALQFGGFLHNRFCFFLRLTERMTTADSSPSTRHIMVGNFHLASGEDKVCIKRAQLMCATCTIRSFSQHPFIIGGDFNLLPKSVDLQQFKVHTGLMDVSTHSNGHTTNNAKSRSLTHLETIKDATRRGVDPNTENRFQGCIDYIFVKQMHVVFVPSIPPVITLEKEVTDHHAVSAIITNEADLLYSTFPNPNQGNFGAVSQQGWYSMDLLPLSFPHVSSFQ
eukprot:CAMPEP_0113912250 /NCGR_PEP_ID=MMETSP0780_2-20120614/28807_1 /TAXON_ID=652834 /ORGANISM="Palpitomonas bilix" /LENGTH=640 /DNA_ID=CAMNT_0000909157 /DNA_START=385 /DNA_END=2307 /DNA_ORIENTATION=+ /assembly_acc=CAM_ASM_000599